jgi:uncharacterized membrane protein (DUF485 family)
MNVERQLEVIAARRWKIAIALTVAMLVTYFGFLLLVAYAKGALGALVMPGLSWGILLGALVILVAWVLTGIYVRWANRVYDVELAELRNKTDASEKKEASE